MHKLLEAAVWIIAGLAALTLGVVVWAARKGKPYNTITESEWLDWHKGVGELLRKAHAFIAVQDRVIATLRDELAEAKAKVQP